MGYDEVEGGVTLFSYYGAWGGGGNHFYPEKEKEMEIWCWRLL